MSSSTEPEQGPGDSDALAVVRAYHERTKHHIGRYAAGPETLDWDQQPDPFRRYAGTPTVELPLTADRIGTHYVDLFRTAPATSQPLNLDNVAALFELSFGLSAWKQYATERWAVRCNPSSGNLHPTEAYAVLPDMPGLATGLYHYVSREHAFEKRCQPRTDTGDMIGNDCLLVGLSSIHWREAWKYGERAYRYCQLDVGHALAAVRYAAAALGWSCQWLQHWDDRQVGAMLGLNRVNDFAGAEPEYPEAVVLVHTTPDRPVTCDNATTLVPTATDGTWSGHANTLDPAPMYQWPVIDEAATAARRPAVRDAPWDAPQAPTLDGGSGGDDKTLPATSVIRQRRSAQAFDRNVSIDQSVFFRLLDRLLPRPGVGPWDLMSTTPRIHPVLFVHAVDGLAPGLYALPRRREAVEPMRTAMRAEFQWQTPPDCPSHLPLFQLLRANARKAAGTLSCHQAIAADGAFSLGMLAEFDEVLQQGPWNYRRLYWEAGILGQALYLEAESHNLRGTGIGCFFDDAVHETLGLTDTRFQSLYHFTIGQPIVDQRIVTLSPYHHLQRS